MVAFVSYKLWREVLSESSRIKLLVTAATPQQRIDQHIARLTKSFSCPQGNIEIKLIDDTCEEPSKLIERGVWLFADSAVSSLSNSLKLARDWQTKWYLPQDDAAGRQVPLYRCATNPHKQQRRR